MEGVSKTAGRGISVAMLLSNPFVSDYRVYKEAKALVEQGYRVTVFAWDREKAHSPSENVDGIEIERIAVGASYGRGILQAPALMLYMWKALRRIKRGRFDIVHCHDLETLPAGILFGKLTGAKVVFDAHEATYYADTGGPRRLTVVVGKSLQRLLSPRADAVLVVNDSIAADYRRLGVKRLTVIANYPEQKVIGVAEREQGRDCFCLGRIGAMQVDAGIEELIQAFTILRREFPYLRLLLAGHSLPEYQEQLERLVSQAGEGIDFIPQYSYTDIPALYSRLDVCVLPTKPTEWFRKVSHTKFFEALSQGVPVIVTDVGGLGDIVREHGCGLVLERVTAEGIVSSLRKVIEDESLRRQMSESAIRVAKEQYNWEHSAQQLLAVYASLGLGSRS